MAKKHSADIGHGHSSSTERTSASLTALVKGQRGGLVGMQRHKSGAAAYRPKSPLTEQTRVSYAAMLARKYALDALHSLADSRMIIPPALGH